MLSLFLFLIVIAQPAARSGITHTSKNIVDILVCILKLRHVVDDGIVELHVSIFLPSEKLGLGIANIHSSHVLGLTLAGL